MSLARCALAILAVLCAAIDSESAEISGVYHEPALLPAVGQGEVTIHFRLSAPSRAAVHLHDGRQLRIRSLDSGRTLPAGEHKIAWDGRDARGRPVPPEAYTYAIEFADAAGELAIWDVSDAAGADPLAVERVRWDPDARRVSYSLAQPGRVRIRAGLETSGPLLATLIDWVPRTAGVHGESWDGNDASGVLDLSRRPDLNLVAEAFSLPRNAIVVGPASRAVKLIDGLDASPRPSRAAPRPKRMYDYASQPIETRRDFSVRLELVGDFARDGDGLPLVSGTVPLRVSVDEANLAGLLGERCEIVFYLDGQYLFETETGYLPMTWRWNANETTPGTHYLTTNIRGYEGHFGMGTVKVQVAPARADGGGSS